MVSNGNGGGDSDNDDNNDKNCKREGCGGHDNYGDNGGDSGR